jgi:protein-L-isoaspartate(D-aspartate) O-methyltransferase
MIESQLKPSGIVSPRVVSAFHAVAREDFVAPDRRNLAYIDAAQPLGHGRSLLPPLSLGRLIEAADIGATDRLLVVGAATGYSAALCARLAAHVVALESDPALAARARAVLANLANVTLVEGPLEAGWAALAPYSAILIDGGVEAFPQSLVAQLAEGGRCVAIVHGDDGVPRASVGRWRAGHLHVEPLAQSGGDLLSAFRKPRGFQF